MTKKEFCLQVVDQLLENPRKVLAGHGIQAAVLQQILRRPDVMNKLAGVLWSLKSAKKGAVGLKKAANFQIKGYKTFAEMNMRAREDIETFIGGLSGDDAAQFNNAENVLTILMLPDTKGFVPGQEGDDVVESIIVGKSVVLPFDSAVRKEYKIPGGVYLVVMVGDSAVRPAEEKISLRDSKGKNKTKAAKRTPAKIKASLKRKANKKLELLKKQRNKLQQQAYNTKMQLQQANYMRDVLGDDDIMYGIGKRNMQASNFQINKNAIMAGLTPEQKGTLSAAQFLAKRGDKSAAKALLKNMGMDKVVGATAPTSGDAVVAARKAEIRKKIRALVAKNEQLMLDLSLAPAQKRLSIKSMISKNNSTIKALRAKLNVYKGDLTSQGLNNKAQMLQEVNASIEANIAEGASITQALNSAIAALDATPQQKQQVKQAVMQQVADGMPMQYAVQQAIQQMPVQTVQQELLDTDVDDTDMVDTTLTGNVDLDALLASI